LSFLVQAPEIVADFVVAVASDVWVVVINAVLALGLRFPLVILLI
jgi:hypothetical protein